MCFLHESIYPGVCISKNTHKYGVSNQSTRNGNVIVGEDLSAFAEYENKLKSIVRPSVAKVVKQPSREKENVPISKEKKTKKTKKKQKISIIDDDNSEDNDELTMKPTILPTVKKLKSQKHEEETEEEEKKEKKVDISLLTSASSSKPSKLPIVSSTGLQNELQNLMENDNVVTAESDRLGKMRDSMLKCMGLKA